MGTLVLHAWLLGTPLKDAIPILHRPYYTVTTRVAWIITILIKETETFCHDQSLRRKEVERFLENELEGEKWEGTPSPDGWCAGSHGSTLMTSVAVEKAARELSFTWERNFRPAAKVSSRDIFFFLKLNINYGNYEDPYFCHIFKVFIS